MFVLVGSLDMDETVLNVLVILGSTFFYSSVRNSG